MIRDGEQLRIETNGQTWLLSWHRPEAPPDGKAHGSAGICVTAKGEVVLISTDGVQWDFPAGRPEGYETWEQTLRREVQEEACATVGEARLLGFSRGVCIDGPEAGLVLVRSLWWARVTLLGWAPRFEIAHRRLMPAGEVPALLPRPYLPIFQRALAEAGMPSPLAGPVPSGPT